MKLTLSLLAVLAACSVTASPVSDEFPQVPYNRYIDFINEDGIKQTIDLEEEPDVAFLESLSREEDEDDINGYFLFTRDNPEVAQELVAGDADSVKNSNFNPEVSTAVVVHGWLSNQESGINPAIRDAFLEQDDVNVIILDWRPLAIRNYVTAARGVPAVGRRLGRFLRFLSEATGTSLESVHIIGFSLGAHLAGNAGRELEGQVGRISALDPAGPLWNINSNRINSDDAIYVEGMHTDGGLELSLGLGFSIGDVDFFPNGGNNQPGCFTSSICSHNRAWRLFSATVRYNHLEGRGCSNILQITLNTCRGDTLRMGNADLNKTGSGRFRANTRRRYPY